MIFYKSIKTNINAIGLAKIIIAIIVQHNGLFNLIITNKDLLVTFKFWSLLWYFFSIKRYLFSVFYS